MEHNGQAAMPIKEKVSTSITKNISNDKDETINYSPQKYPVTWYLGFYNADSPILDKISKEFHNFDKKKIALQEIPAILPSQKVFLIHFNNVDAIRPLLKVLKEAQLIKGHPMEQREILSNWDIIKKAKDVLLENKRELFR